MRAHRKLNKSGSFVRLHEVDEDKHHVHLILELIQLGTLRDVIKFRNLRHPLIEE